MIEGLKVIVSAEELKGLCKARAAYHADRAKQYEAQLETLKSLNVANTSNRPGDDAEHKITTHKALAAELEFISAHLSPLEYLLNSGDLVKLGVSYRGY